MAQGLQHSVKGRISTKLNYATQAAKISRNNSYASDSDWVCIVLRNDMHWVWYHFVNRLDIARGANKCTTFGCHAAVCKMPQQITSACFSAVVCAQGDAK